MKIWRCWILFLCCALASVQASEAWDEARLQVLWEQAEQQARDYVRCYRSDCAAKLPKDLKNASLNQSIYRILGEQHDFDQLTSEVQVKVLNDLGVFTTSKERGFGFYALAAQRTGNKNVRDDLWIDAFSDLARIDHAARLFALKNLPTRLNSFDYAYRSFLYKYGFVLTNSEVEQDRENALICLRFNQPPADAMMQDVQALLHSTPALLSPWQRYGHSLCAQGEWMQVYQVKVDKALMSYERIALLEDVEQDFYTGIRKPLLRFVQNTQRVMPANSAQEITLESSNVAEIQLRVFRIPPDNFSHEMAQKFLSGDERIGEYEINRLKDTYGEEVFHGRLLPKQGKINELLRSNFALSEVIPDRKPGLYVLAITHQEEKAWERYTVLPVLISQDALLAWKTEQGLSVELRRLRDFTPQQGALIRLYAYNHELLGEGLSDKNGSVLFAPELLRGEGGNRPAYVLHQQGENISYLSLQRGFDLSEKGLDGFHQASTLQAWLWLERKLYRPHDSMHGMILLRNEQHKPYTESIWLELQRPDGQVMLEQELKAHAHGAYSFAYDFAPEAPLGQWQLLFRVARDGHVIAQESVRVDAFIPQQLQVNFIHPAQTLSTDSPERMQLQLRWLDGAPARGVGGLAWQSLQFAPEAFPAWKDYQWGLHDEELKPQLHQEKLELSDDEGVISLNLQRNNEDIYTRPLKLLLRADIQEAGGAINRVQHSLFLKRTAPYLGIHLEKQNHRAKVVMLNAEGVPQSAQVAWEIKRLIDNGYWYYDVSNEEWNYRDDFIEEDYSSGRLDLDQQGVFLPLPQEKSGTWKLLLRGDAAQTAASLVWGSGLHQADKSPDTLLISGDRERYAPGEMVHVDVHAAFDGPGVLLIAQNKILENIHFELKQGHARLSFPWQSDWQQGVWLLAHALNQGADQELNRRAVGMQWLGQTEQPQRLRLSWDKPDSVLPTEDYRVRIRVDGATNGETWLSLAAVDEGIYQMARPSFSDPLSIFMGKRRPQVDYFDMLGEIMHQHAAARLQVRTGAGDESMMTGDGEAPLMPDIEIVSFWSGFVPVINGVAEVKLPLPDYDYNGRLRLMAMAWNDAQYGVLEDSLVVQAPIISRLYAPLYVFEGDRSTLRWHLRNTTAQEQRVQLSLKGDALLQLEMPASEQLLPAQGEQWLSLPFVAVKAGTSELRAEMNSAMGQHVAQKRLAIKNPRPLLLRQRISLLESGAQEDFSQTLKWSGLTEPERVELSLSSGLPFDMEKILQELLRYPYRCNEQITSRAHAFLLREALQERYELPPLTPAEHSQIQKDFYDALNQLRNTQNVDGSFKQWLRSSDDLALSAYITDFLLDAQKQQPTPMLLEKSLNALEEGLRQRVSERRDQIAAAYVLSKTPRSSYANLLRLYEYSTEDDSERDRILLAGALLRHGAYDLVEKLLQSKAVEVNDLNSLAVSVAALWDMRKELQDSEQENLMQVIGWRQDSLLLRLVSVAMQSSDVLNTQEAYRIAALAARLPQMEQNSENEVYVGEKQERFIGRLRLKDLDPQNMPKVYGARSPLWLNVEAWARPLGDISEGYTLKLTYEDLEGGEVNFNNMKINDFFKITLEITAATDAPTDTLLLLYPAAGIEVLENAEAQEVLDEYSSVEQFSRLDDRVLVAFRQRSQEPLRYSFIARAARSGQWQAGAVTVSDLYRSGHFAYQALPAMRINP